MGLDILFYKRRLTAENENLEPNEVRQKCWEDYNETGDESIPNEDEVCGLELLKAYRKYNFLMSFFNYQDRCVEYDDFYGDATYIKIEKYEINEFINEAKRILQVRDTKDNRFKPVAGLFFGSQETDGNYFKAIQECKNDFQTWMDEADDNTEFYMFASW